MLVSVWKKIPRQTVWVLLGLGALLLLLLPRQAVGKSGAGKEETAFFSLEAEERRMEAALSRIPGVGRVTVLLTLDSSEEREYARNTEEDRQLETDRDRSEERSQVAQVGEGALTVRIAYPRYRGALIVTEGGGSELRLAVTQAVAALTGLGTDRITVVTGA